MLMNKHHKGIIVGEFEAKIDQTKLRLEKLS